VLDKYLYQALLDGAEDDSLGDVHEYGFFAARFDFRGDEAEYLDRIAREEGDALTDEERRFLRAQAGAILIEDDQGFVSVEYYDSPRELRERWRELEEAIESSEEY
jgi:hypothetical protein